MKETQFDDIVLHFGLFDAEYYYSDGSANFIIRLEQLSGFMDFVLKNLGDNEKNSPLTVKSLEISTDNEFYYITVI